MRIFVSKRIIFYVTSWLQPVGHRLYVYALLCLQAVSKALYLHNLGLCRLYIHIRITSFSMIRMWPPAQDAQGICVIMQ